MITVGVIGGSGFAGSEVLRLAAGHPELQVEWATGDSNAGTPIADVVPSLAAVHGNDVFMSFDESLLDGVDAVFLGLPHGASQALVPQLVGRVKWIVDLAADFRHRDASVYDTWYGEAHTAPELLERFVYGLPELYREEIRGADCVAAPGCYPTSANLVLAPLVRAGVIDPSHIVVDSACGVSGAGRPPKPNTTFCAVDENFTAYGLLDHRHTPEIEQVLSAGGAPAQVLFTPHLAPMSRGILATCYARPTGATSTSALIDTLRDAYAGEPFVVVTDDPPSTKGTSGSNCAHVTVRHDPRTGWVVALGALDNLLKGAAGQAVQCANLALDLEETAGLPVAGMVP
jgi:N-acetyl-gamma-glutamyl-phosphate reductase